MNNNLQIFANNEFGEIRVATKDNEPWFVGKDVAGRLGYKNTKDALLTHVDEEDKDEVAIPDSIGRMQNTSIINESGLYSLILSSKLPTAKKFKRWVTSVVLPSIRKHGAYMTEQTLEEVLSNPDTLIRLATDLKKEKEERQKLHFEIKQQQAVIEEQAPKVLFADAVSTSKATILVGEMAKILKQNGIDTGEKRLFTWLRDNGYLIKRKGCDYNMPTQRSMELKLFEVKESTHTHSDGHISVNKTTKVTGKGQQYFINKFVGSNQISMIN